MKTAEIDLFVLLPARRPHPYFHIIIIYIVYIFIIINKRDPRFEWTERVRSGYCVVFGPRARAGFSRIGSEARRRRWRRRCEFHNIIILLRVLTRVISRRRRRGPLYSNNPCYVVAVVQNIDLSRVLYYVILYGGRVVDVQRVDRRPSPGRVLDDTHPGPQQGGVRGVFCPGRQVFRCVKI